MIGIRLIGEPGELAEATQRLREVFDVAEESAPYPCRGGSQRVRLYLQATPKPVRAYRCCTCNGTGLAEDATCRDCDGTGIDNHPRD